MTMQTLRDLLVHELKDLYSAEKQLTKALPKMAKAATNESLQEAITKHLEETENQVQRLEEAFAALGIATRGAKCDAMEGLIKEAQKAMKETSDDAVLDAALIAEAQRVEHYEMAGYGCARAFAEQLGENEIADLLQATLDEEAAANEKLNDIALSEVNPAAMEAGGGEEDEGEESEEMEEEEAEV